MNHIDDFQIKQYSKTRQMLSEYNEIAALNPRMLGLIEVDVTKARTLIKKINQNKIKEISFTGWIIHCLAKAVYENKHVHAYRLGKNELIVYENVHVNVFVERLTTDSKKVPISYVIKNANKKDVYEITKEIREVQDSKVTESDSLVGGAKRRYILYFLLPKFLRKKIIKRMLNNTMYFINNAGTIGITAVGMFGRNISGWAIPFGSHTTNIAVGGIKQKPCTINDKHENCDILNLTIQINHNIVDGAPAARFVSKLVELMEEAYGL